jgi:hypothetical protein
MGTQKAFATISLDNENDFTAQVMAEYFNSSGTIYLTKRIDMVGTRLNDSLTEATQSMFRVLMRSPW